MTVTRPRGVTASTLDSESSDRGSNPREAFYREPFGVSLNVWSLVNVEHARIVCLCLVAMRIHQQN